MQSLEHFYLHKQLSLMSSTLFKSSWSSTTSNFLGHRRLNAEAVPSSSFAYDGARVRIKGAGGNDALSLQGSWGQDGGEAFPNAFFLPWATCSSVTLGSPWMHQLAPLHMTFELIQ